MNLSVRPSFGRSAGTVNALAAFGVLFLAACGGAPAGGQGAPGAGSTAPTATSTPAVAAPTSTALPAATQPAAQALIPTITINPNLHASNPETVKLASGDQPTLVEFFAFW